MNSVDQAAEAAYYMNPDMVRFLLIENLALKTLLHKKGLMLPEEHQECHQEAAEILDTKVAAQIEQWKSNPEVAESLQSMVSKFTQKDDHLQTTNDVVAAST